MSHASADAREQASTSVSVVICTYDRPDLLERAVRTARDQRLPTSFSAEVVVVDNSPDGNAARAVTGWAAGDGLPLRYLAHPVPNISHARNRGVAETRGDFVAFLDDDEWCRPGWLAALVATALDTGADVTFGAVLPDFIDGAPPWDPTGRSYERRLDQESGTSMGIRHDARASGRWIGTGNSLLRRRTCLNSPEPFDPRLGRSGGEDYDLFVRLDHAGRRMVWCREAEVFEVVPAERARWGYMLQRSWRGGQQWATIAVRQARSPSLAAARVTIRALAQLTLVGAGWMSARLTGAPDLNARRLKLAQVSGKLLWWTMPTAHR